MKSVFSESLRSIPSTNTLKSARSEYDGPNPIDFEEYIVTACKKFACSYPVVIRKNVQCGKALARNGQVPDDTGKPSKRNESAKSRNIILITQFVNESLLTDIKSGNVFTHPLINLPVVLIEEKTVTMDILFNNMNQLIEIKIHNARHIPRQLLQLIGLILPYFEQLAKISITSSLVDVYTIYELSKMLPLSFLTTICLDQSHLPQANYAILLDIPRLLTLSPSRCLLNDVVCKQLASKLHYRAAAEIGLLTLNVSSNQITDAGAKYFADALRTNRHLRYLNLADNRIGDEGACRILDTLMGFPLTDDEIVNKRRRYLEYLKTRKALLSKHLNEWECKSADESQASRKSTPRKRKASTTSLRNKVITKKERPAKQSNTDEYFSGKVDILVRETAGPFLDPFGPNFCKTKADCTYCTGNMCLSYLNLSYNSLTYLSLKKLHSVVQYQARNKKGGLQGLFKIIIDGNLIPVTSPELRTISDMLNTNISTFGTKGYTESGKRRSKTMARVSVLPEKSTTVGK